MTALLSVDGVTKRFRGLVAVDRVSFAVPEGAIFAVIGPNGAGKTTLFNMIAGLFAPDGGAIHFAGTRIDIPLHHANAAYVRSHFDTIEFCVPDGPKPDEIVFIVGLSIGGRPHPRVGGLRADEIKLWDGQR